MEQREGTCIARIVCMHAMVDTQFPPPPQQQRSQLTGELPHAGQLLAGRPLRQQHAALAVQQRHRHHEDQALAALSCRWLPLLRCRRGRCSGCRGRRPCCCCRLHAPSSTSLLPQERAGCGRGLGRGVRAGGGAGRASCGRRCCYPAAAAGREAAACQGSCRWGGARLGAWWGCGGREQASGGGGALHRPRLGPTSSHEMS